jgi:hypothetical protein
VTDPDDNVVPYRKPRPAVNVKAQTALIRELIEQAKEAKKRKGDQK